MHRDSLKRRNPVIEAMICFASSNASRNSSSAPGLTGSSACSSITRKTLTVPAGLRTGDRRPAASPSNQVRTPRAGGRGRSSARPATRRGSGGSPRRHPRKRRDREPSPTRRTRVSCHRGQRPPSGARCERSIANGRELDMVLSDVKHLTPPRRRGCTYQAPSLAVSFHPGISRGTGQLRTSGRPNADDPSPERAGTSDGPGVVKPDQGAAAASRHAPSRSLGTVRS